MRGVFIAAALLCLYALCNAEQDFKSSEDQSMDEEIDDLMALERRGRRIVNKRIPLASGETKNIVFGCPKGIRGVRWNVKATPSTLAYTVTCDISLPQKKNNKCTYANFKIEGTAYCGTETAKAFSLTGNQSFSAVSKGKSPACKYVKCAIVAA